MTMYRGQSLETYLADAAARKPAPGGGSVSAAAGALAAAMSEMSANFTVGNEKYADVQQEVAAILDELATRRDELLELVDRDVEAYGAVDAAYSMPRESDQQKEERRGAIQQALRKAMAAPFDIMHQCVGVARLADRLVEIGNRNLITDVGVSAILAGAACAAARLNVEVNLKFLKDPDLARETTAEMDEMSREVHECRERVCARVADYLSP
ncbi:MAG: cyclodeaminase/cyclohydrolase family protein [Candidatus Brocadiia bacterium]